MTKTSDTPLKWVHFSTASHPDTWDTQELGAIQFATSFEAKKAEALFSRLERERVELIEALQTIADELQQSNGGKGPTGGLTTHIHGIARALLARLKEAA
jgi:hypothetical protein